MNQAYSRQPVKVTHLNNMRGQLKSGRENCIKSNQQHDFITDCLDIYFCLFFFCFRGIKGCYAVCCSSVWQRLGSGQGQGTVAAI